MCLCRFASIPLTGDGVKMEEFALRIPEAACLGVSLTLSGICYYLYRKSRKTVDKLDVSFLSCLINNTFAY